VAIRDASREAVRGTPIVVSLRGTETQVKLAYHFVGIGGCGMSGLAQVLARKGQIVSGSDVQASTVTDTLEELGVQVHIGHGTENLPETIHCLVVSAAVQDDNPELVWAWKNNIRVLKYAEMLGQISRDMHTLAISGTHGKSTSSGWLAYMFKQADQEPSFVIGAEVDQLGGGSGAGSSEYLVVEACEYDRSFLNLHPTAAAILNIERDHLDYYSGLDEIVQTFGEFAQKVADAGLIVANGADDNVAEALAGVQTPCEFFNIDGPAQWQAQNLEYDLGRGCFDLVYQGRVLGWVQLALAGRHNVANALAVAALARHAGLSDQQICAGLAGFTGVGRRMTLKEQVNGIVIMDDYAHHPTEIKTTLEAIRSRYEPRKLWCVFQPHQHSRTRFLLQEFASSFGAADIILLPDIYFVRDSEALRQEVNAAMLAERIVAEGGEARYLGGFDRIAEELCREARAEDVIVTMGAGDVWKLADELVYRLGRDR
jgi:UDP-N-acetylmuramate--alanine ligase